MKFLFGLGLALAATIVWQTSVLSKEKAAESTTQTIAQVQQENAAAGRVPIDQADCD